MCSSFSGLLSPTVIPSAVAFAFSAPFVVLPFTLLRPSFRMFFLFALRMYVVLRKVVRRSAISTVIAFEALVRAHEKVDNIIHPLPELRKFVSVVTNLLVVDPRAG